MTVNHKNLHQRAFDITEKSKELYKEVWAEVNLPPKHSAPGSLGKISKYFSSSTNQTAYI
jgi:hypothetical protein